MTMALSRYTEIRERLIKLWNIVNNKTFPVLLTPAMTMTVDELRNRETFSRDNVIPDYDAYEEYEERKLTCGGIIDILPYVVRDSDLGYGNANETIPMIYESSQEYIRLWVELVTNANEFRIPLDELRKLELLAYTLFPQYKKIKKFLKTRDFYMNKDDQLKQIQEGVLPLGVLFGMNSQEMGGKDNMHFISYLEALGIHTGRTTISTDELSSIPTQEAQTVNDGLFSVQPEPQLPSWEFKR